MGQMTISPLNIDGTQDEDFRKLEKNIGKLSISENKSTNLMYRTMRMIDFLQATNRYKWKNLPKNIYGWYIEKMLYYSGSLCFFKNGDEFLTLPYAMINGINLFGLPYEIQPIALNGQPFGEKKLAVGMFGEEVTSANAVILYGSIPEFANDRTVPQLFINEPIIQEIAYRFGVMRKNIKQSFISYVFRTLDDKQKEALEMALNGSLESENEKSILVVRGDLNLDNIAVPREYESQSIWQDITSFQNTRLTALGIQNGGTFLKKERVVGEESSTQDEQARLILDGGLQMRKLWCKQVNEIWGLNIDVEINRKIIKKFKEENEKREKSPSKDEE